MSNNNNTRHELANMSWGLIIFLWMCWWPLGLGLTIGKLTARKKLQEEEQRRQWQNQPFDYGRDTQSDKVRTAYGRTPSDPRQHRDYEGISRATGERSYAARSAQTASTTHTGKKDAPPTKEQTKARGRRSWLVPVLLIFGALFALAGLSMTVEGIDSLLWSLQQYAEFSSWPITEYIIPGIFSAIGGVGMFFTGWKKRKEAKQEKLLTTIVGPRDSVSIKELSAACGLNQTKTIQLVQSAIGHGLFGGDAYLDMLSKTLVVRGKAPAPEKEPTPEKKVTNRKKTGKEDKYQTILRQLRQANDAIPGKEMSDKIDRMEQISARIFELAKKDPDKEAQLTRFMDYYLPTSLKLLNTYADLDKQGIRGENIDETKASIEVAMDLLVTAFENQLDKLYESDALDVSSEITALQGMLNLDGLTPGTDFSAPDEQWQKDTEI